MPETSVLVSSPSRKLNRDDLNLLHFPHFHLQPIHRSHAHPGPGFDHPPIRQTFHAPAFDAAHTHRAEVGKRFPHLAHQLMRILHDVRLARVLRRGAALQRSAMPAAMAAQIPAVMSYAIKRPMPPTSAAAAPRPISPPEGTTNSTPSNIRQIAKQTIDQTRYAVAFVCVGTAGGSDVTPDDPGPGAGGALGEAAAAPPGAPPAAPAGALGGELGDKPGGEEGPPNGAPDWPGAGAARPEPGAGGAPSDNSLPAIASATAQKNTPKKIDICFLAIAA
jgi:hypothetical protein